MLVGFQALADKYQIKLAQPLGVRSLIGTRSNFIFSEYDDALPAWRYPDLTERIITAAKMAFFKSLQ